jgi:hypothetical protein
VRVKRRYDDLQVLFSARWSLLRDTLLRPLLAVSVESRHHLLQLFCHALTLLRVSICHQFLTLPKYERTVFFDRATPCLPTRLTKNHSYLSKMKHKLLPVVSFEMRIWASSSVISFFSRKSSKDLIAVVLLRWLLAGTSEATDMTSSVRMQCGVSGWKPIDIFSICSTLGLCKAY